MLVRFQLFPPTFCEVDMTNILSYHNNSVSGEEILAWAKAFRESDITRSRYARHILRRYSNIIPNRRYRVYTQYESTGCGDIKHLPYIVKA